MEYVIIGNSAAAVGCVEGIRQRDAAGHITIVSQEAFHTYSRPLISYLLLGKTDEQRMKYRPDDFYEKNGCTLLSGRRAVRVDGTAHRVELDDGTALPYDKLLAATGSVPFVPPMEGLEQVKERFTFYTLADARALAAALEKPRRVLIVGAGLIGLKCAEGILARASSITVVDLADRILPSILDEEGAALVQRHLEAQGVRFILGDSVARFDGDGARLKGGQTIPFDVLVTAVGVRPNVSLLKEAGAQVQRGVITDVHGRTSLPEVYAAGDCTQSVDTVTGESRVLALLPNAYMQGEAAGISMAGGEGGFDRAMALNAIGFCGLHLMTAGVYDGEVYEKKDGSSYKKLFYADNRLKGYILIGDVQRAGIYTALIRDKTPLDSLDFELICEKPQLMAFTRAERAKKLGGEA